MHIGATVNFYCYCAAFYHVTFLLLVILYVELPDTYYRSCVLNFNAEDQF